MRDHYMNELEQMEECYSQEKVGYFARKGDTREMAVSTKTRVILHISTRKGGPLL